jgi:hypothetical protein
MAFEHLPWRLIGKGLPSDDCLGHGILRTRRGKHDDTPENEHGGNQVT